MLWNIFLVYIKFELLAKLNISAKIEEVQAMVKKELTENVGVDVSKVLVNISKLGIKEKEVDHSPARDRKDPIEHKRGKGDPNSEKYVVFQDLKELI